MTRRQHVKHLKRQGSNPLVALECILAEKMAAEGRLSSLFTGFIDDTVIRKLRLFTG